jgi:hypothetical protein
MSRREQKSSSWISRRLKPEMTMLAKASSNLNYLPNELVVRQSAPGKDVRTEAVDTVEICCHATIGEDIANREDSACAVVKSKGKVVPVLN